MWTADADVAWEQTRIELSGRDGMSGLDRIADARFIVSDAWRSALGYVDSFPVLDVARMPGWTPQLGGFASGADVSFEVARIAGVYYAGFTSCGARGSFVW